MKTRYYQYAVIAIAAMLLMACNGIETVGLDADSVISKHKTSLIRDVNVTQNEAIGIANMFAHSNAGSDNPQTKGAFSSTKMISSSETISEDGQNLMYVFNYEGGGFVIVGSTRNYYPILAYSDEGSFILKDDMGPVDVWLDETKVSIKNSGSLDNDTKAQMQNLWARYDGTFVDPAQARLSSRRPQTRSTGEDACWDRIDSLTLEHGSEGWTYLPLSAVEDVFADLDLESYYDAICYSAYQNNSALNETVIGYRTPVNYQTGPLIMTEWHPLTPFNDYCPSNCYAGYGPLAVAQVMKYWEKPTSMTWNIYTFGWNNIPAVPNNNSSDRHGQLIMYLWHLLQVTVSSPTQIMTTVNKIQNGLDSIGYTATISNPHSNVAVKNQLLYYNRPVIMYGKDTNQNIEHFWVCEGAKEYNYDQILFYTENQPNGAGNFTQGMYSYSNPGSLGGGNPSYYYYMNWGMGSSPYFSPNGWYSANDVTLDGTNLSSNRKDIFVYW